MRALVTGANGFVGSFLVDHLLEAGRRVRVLVRKSSDLKFIEGKDVEKYFGDVCDPGTLPEASSLEPPTFQMEELPPNSLSSAFDRL